MIPQIRVNKTKLVIIITLLSPVLIAPEAKRSGVLRTGENRVSCLLPGAAEDRHPTVPVDSACQLPSTEVIKDNRGYTGQIRSPRCTWYKRYNISLGANGLLNLSIQSVQKIKISIGGNCLFTP